MSVRDWRRGWRLLRWAVLATALVGAGTTSCGEATGPDAVARLEVTPAVVTLDVGDSVRLNVRAVGADGADVTGAPVSMTSADSGVASVSATGVVRGIGVGNTTVLVTSDGASATIPVRVGQVPATIDVSPVQPVVVPGEGLQLVVTLRDAHGTAITGIAPAFVALDPSTVTVTATGRLTGVTTGVGRVSITAAPVVRTIAVLVVGHPDGALVTRVALGDRPFGIAISPLGTVYVTRLDAARISRADLPTLTFGDSVTVGQTPTDVAFDPMGATAYVANQFGNSVGVVDVATNRQIRTIAVNGNPFRVLVSPDGRRLYVTTNAANLLVIDRTSGSTVLEYSLPSPSNGLAFHPNGVLLYGTTLDGLVYEIDTATDSARALTTTGMLQDIAVTRDGGQLIIARQDGPLEVRDTDTGVLLQTVGAASGVLGLRLSPDGTRLYAGLLSGDVRVLDPRTWTVVQTVSVSSPRRIAFDRLGAVAAIADESGAVVFVQ